MMERALLTREHWNEIEVTCPKSKEDEASDRKRKAYALRHSCPDTRILVRFDTQYGENHHFEFCPFCGRECESKQIGN